MQPTRWEIIKSYLGWEDALAVALILLGAIGYLIGPIPSSPGLADFYLELRPVLIGTGIAVLFIDNANEMYKRRAEKERLILQMGSPEHSFAIEAARQLSVRGWLHDGSLRKANLIGANLSGANLTFADFSGADLSGANLREANLIGANLSGADLNYADLSRANLSEAKNLSEAQIKSIKSLAGATMPDGTRHE